MPIPLFTTPGTATALGAVAGSRVLVHTKTLTGVTAHCNRPAAEQV